MTFSLIKEKDSIYWLAKVSDGEKLQCDYFTSKKQAWSWIWSILLLTTIKQKDIAW